MTGADDQPEWWRDNERLRAEMGLPEYRPPRFADGAYTHGVVERIEDARDCRIRFVGVGVRYADDWEVRIDGTTAFEIGRHRDERGNTVYEMSAEAFREAIDDHFADG